MDNKNRVYFAPSSMMHHHAVQHAASAASELGLGFTDKRNRNPNWTDHEIIRFLDILQEEKVLKDLMAQRNKQVFCYVAQRMTGEGSEKTWDQCRIKLKNLKSQYRYVKDRIPNIDEVDLEDDDVLKQLVAECQGRGISPSNIKHLRYLRRFLQKTTDYAANSSNSHFKPTLEVRPEIMTSGLASPTTTNNGLASRLRFQDSDNLIIDEAESVSPPSTPLSVGIRLISASENENLNENSQSSSKRAKKSVENDDFNSGLLTGSVLDGYRFIEKFNRDMMDQFLDYQRRVAASQIRWEQERYRQEQLAIEQWRQEAREHEKQMFSIFCGALSQCNAALNVLMKTRGDHSNHHHIVESSSKNLDHRSSSSSGEDKSPAPHQDRNITENNGTP